QRVRQVRVTVGGAGSGNPVESGRYCCVSNGMHVDDQSLFVGGNAELVEFFLVIEQIPVVTSVLVRLGEMRGLRRELGHTVSENFDSGDVQMGNVVVRLASLLHSGEFCGWILREHLRKRNNL